ncbi:MAG: DUF4340 domain-containing protein [bacterium]
MRLKTTLILFVGAALALAYFFLIEQPRHETAVRRAERTDALTRLEPGAITGLSIRRPGLALEFERRGGIWHMLEPVADEGDPATLNVLIREITDARVENRFPAPESSLVEYGLEEPAAVDRLTTASMDSTFVLDIGELNLTKSSFFARISGAGDVVLLPAGIRRYSLLPLFAYRNKRVFQLPVDDVQRLIIASGGREQDWSLDESGRWHTMRDGHRIAGDAARITDVVRELRSMRATDIPFPVSDRDAYFRDVAGRVDLRTRSNEQVAVTFSAPLDTGASCYVETSVSGRISLVDSVVLDIFEKTVNDLRDRRLLHFERERAAEIKLQTPDGDMSITRSGGGWAFVNPEFGIVSARAAAKLVTRLENLDFTAVVEESLKGTGMHGFDRPTFLLVVLDTDGGVADAVTAGDRTPGGERYYVTSRSTGILAVIDTAVLDGLIADFRNLAE